MDNNQIKTKSFSVGLTTVLLFFAIIGLGVMGYFLYTTNGEKEKISSELEDTKNLLNEQQNVKKEEENTELDAFENYQNNYNKSLNSTIKDENQISIDLGSVAEKVSQKGLTRVYVDSNAEAYIDISSDSEFYTTYGEKTKIDTKVANVFVCPVGSDGVSDIILIKKNGTVSIIYGEDIIEGKLEAKTKTEVKDIVSVITYIQVDEVGNYENKYSFIDIDGNILAIDEADEEENPDDPSNLIKDEPEAEEKSSNVIKNETEVERDSEDSTNVIKNETEVDNDSENSSNVIKNETEVDNDSENSSNII